MDTWLLPISEGKKFISVSTNKEKPEDTDFYCPSCQEEHSPYDGIEQCENCELCLDACACEANA